MGTNAPDNIGREWTGKGVLAIASATFKHNALSVQYKPKNQSKDRAEICLVSNAYVIQNKPSHNLTEEHREKNRIVPSNFGKQCFA